MAHARRSGGFTLIELLVVILIIGMLAAIALPRFIGPKTSANQSTAISELGLLEKAVIAARLAKNQTLMQAAASDGWIGGPCVGAADNPSGSQPRDLVWRDGVHDRDRPIAEQSRCWSRYILAITEIETASGVDLTSLKDGDANGAPYYIDENEGERPATPCAQDVIGFYVGGKMGSPGTTAFTPTSYVVSPDFPSIRAARHIVAPHNTAC